VPNAQGMQYAVSVTHNAGVKEKSGLAGKIAGKWPFLGIRAGFSPENTNELGWRRGSESGGAFSGNQPAYPDLQGHFNPYFTGLQAVFGTIRPPSGLSRHTHGFNTIIEEIVEGFVEGFLTS